MSIEARTAPRSCRPAAPLLEVAGRVGFWSAFGGLSDVLVSLCSRRSVSRYVFPLQKFVTRWLERAPAVRKWQDVFLSGSPRYGRFGLCSSCWNAGVGDAFSQSMHVVTSVVGDNFCRSTSDERLWNDDVADQICATRSWKSCKRCSRVSFEELEKHVFAPRASIIQMTRWIKVR